MTVYFIYCAEGFGERGPYDTYKEAKEAVEYAAATCNEELEFEIFEAECIQSATLSPPELKPGKLTWSKLT